MTTQPPPTSPAVERSEDPPKPDLVVIHQITVLDTAKGWRTTVRIQDGWQGATLSHWSRGGSPVERGQRKAVDDLESALEEAYGYLATF